jgi:hypothetical protein
VGLPIEVEELRLIGNTQESAVESVGPAVVSAKEKRGFTTVVAHHSIAAVGADVVKGANLALLVACDQD